MFLFDTDHISILQAQTQPEVGRILQRLSRHPPADFFFSIVSFHEQAVGAHNYVNRARRAADAVRGYEMFEVIRAGYAGAPVLPFDAPAAALFDNLRAQRVRIGTMDLRIAAVALSRTMTVLTRNLSDFRQVPGLQVDDWTA